MRQTTTLLYTIVFFLYAAITVEASDAMWRSGQLVRWNDTVLMGELAYNWSAEVVLLRQADGRVQAFSAQQVRQFGWFDYDTHKLRSFVSLTHQTDQEHRIFYEVCLEGELTVVRRLRRSRGLFRKAFSHPKHYVDQPKLNRDHSQFDYFVHDNGQLRTFDRFYPDIYQPLMRSQDKALKQYVYVHNINERTMLGRLILIDRYNAMTQAGARTASARSLTIHPD